MVPRKTSLLLTGRQMLCSMSVQKCIRFCIPELQSWPEVYMIVWWSDDKFWQYHEYVDGKNPICSAFWLLFFKYFKLIWLMITAMWLKKMAIEGNNPIVPLPTTPIFPHKGDNSVSLVTTKTIWQSRVTTLLLPSQQPLFSPTREKIWNS